MRALTLLLTCAGCGACLLFGAALVCHFACIDLDPATRHAIYLAADLPQEARAGWPPDIPGNAQVLADCGVGFTRLEIRWKRGGPTDPLVSRCFMSTLGWPQPLFSSGSEAVGRYDAVDLPGWTLTEEKMDRSTEKLVPKTTAHWSGLVFSIASF